MLKSPRPHVFRIALYLFLVLTAASTWAQNFPSDLEIIGTAGGLGPNAGHATVRIAADGQGTYRRFQSGDLAAPVLESSTFALTIAEVEQLWLAIQTGDFFNLQAKYTAEDIIDRTYAELIISANGNVHTVTTQNIAVTAFDNIISTLNNLTPSDDDLIYDTSEPFTFTSLDICEQSGQQSQRTLSKQINQATGEPILTDLMPAEAPSLNNNAHPGTVIAYRMTLEEAISRGIVTLRGKGGGTVFGDAVSISIDNSSSVTNDQLNLSLYLDLWGPAASASTSQAVSSAIVNAWGGKTTTGGQTLTLEVLTRTTSGGTSAPGTAGFHQIKLVADSSYASNVVGRGTSFDVNQGVGSGTWSTTGSKANELYAHEAGHLLGLDDRYEEYRKQDDDTWIRQSDGEPFTTSELANELAPSRPDLTLAEIQNKLEDGRRSASGPKPGSENDLMAALDGSVQQSDIDALAAQAGLVIEIRPGTILVNKDGRRQNFVITRSEDVFVPAGGSKTLGGLYVACVDLSRFTPRAGAGFDLAPPLSEWRGIEAAQFLQTLFDYLDEQERFCASDFLSQLAIWRITDNRSVGDDAGAWERLQEAGIDLDDQILDFPRMTNPNAADPNTSLITPLELFVLDLASSSTGVLLNPGETVTLTGVVNAPSLEGISTVFAWSLDTPTGSASTLTSHQGETTLFTTDVRGIYQVLLQSEVTDTMANTFTLETAASFTVADAHTETFETGVLELAGPFFWKNSEDNPWIVTDHRGSHTGVFSAASGDIDKNGITTLKASFEQLADGSISFAYSVSSARSDSLVFSVDGDVHGSWSSTEADRNPRRDWNIFSIDLAAGEHTAVWAYKKYGSVSRGADRAWIDDVFFPESSLFTSVESPADDVFPATYQLLQNYPNPFNPTTTIQFALPQQSQVTLELFDLLGRQVVTLVDEELEAGEYKVDFQAGELPSGVYFYVMKANSFTEAKKLTLLR